jgi:hypothetical protein
MKAGVKDDLLEAILFNHIKVSLLLKLDASLLMHQDHG